MVRFLNEIILKYLLGISKCTKLAGNKTKKKNPQYLRTNTSLHIRHIYTSEIILATSLKSFFKCYHHFSWKTKVSPSSVLNSTTAGFWTDPALTTVTHTHFWFPFRPEKKRRINISNSYVPSWILEFILISLLRIQSLNRTRQDKGKKAAVEHLQAEEQDCCTGVMFSCGAQKLPEFFWLYISFGPIARQILEIDQDDRQYAVWAGNAPRWPVNMRVFVLEPVEI